MEKTKEVTVSQIVNKIKDIRKLKGFSNEAMAVDLEMSTSAYNKLERMESALSLERFLRIKDILDVPFSEFFDNASKNCYNFHELKDNSIGHQEIQTLNQENKEFNQKLISTLEQENVHLKEEIAFLRKMLEK